MDIERERGREKERATETGEKEGGREIEITLNKCNLIVFINIPIFFFTKIYAIRACVVFFVF